MDITKIYKKGYSAVNEDAYAINHSDSIYAVMDGATGLGTLSGDIASRVVQEEMLKENPDQSLLERITKANQLTGEATVARYKEIGGAVEEDSIEHMSKLHRSSTGAAIIQFNRAQTTFDYVHAGDCMIVLQYENGDIRFLTYDLISYLDQRAIEELDRLNQATSTPSLSFAERKKSLSPLLKENRCTSNTRHGYGIIDGSKAALHHIEYGRIALNRVQQILLISDGLQIPLSTGETKTWEKTAAYAFENGLDRLVEKIEKREADDSDCRVYPRLKPADDKTALLLTL
ncbi:MAG TPA: PP2C family serine/threonine-protein phosphatase [Pseudogracilibacillus sp.]|nr:PP2C family serine/threonine-protein phosphatase [Pseudogracilibacillus sp.]